MFVDISADWCVTCKVNEHRVLNQPEVIAALRQPDVVALRGDWSQPSETIAAFLKSRNRYAIPFNGVWPNAGGRHPLAIAGQTHPDDHPEQSKRLTLL